MSKLYTGILIGATVSGQFSSTTKVVNRQLRMIGDEASKLSKRKSKLDLLGNAESDLEKAQAKAASARRAVEKLRQELDAGPPRKDWGKDLEKARAASEKAAGAVGKARERMVRAAVAFRDAGGAAGGYAANMQRVGTELDRVQAKQAKLNRYVEAKSQLGEWASSTRTAMIGATAAVAGVTAAFIAPAASFEDAMLGVAKQVDGARDDNGQLTQTYFDMRREIQMLGREMPMATNEIAEMVTAGARMGVAKNELIGFTKTAGMMAEAFEMPAGELAEQMGKIAGLYKIPIPAIGDLADTINYLDDNAISKGGDIIDFLTRTGGAAGAVKITGKEMAALGSTLLTMGESNETASTSVNAMFGKLAAATKGTKQFKSAVKEIGLSVKGLQEGMQVDAMGTVEQVFTAIAKQDPKEHLGLLVQMFGQEHAPKLVKLVTGMKELNRQMELANSAAAKGSMGREYSARLTTFSAQWAIFKNRIGETAVNIGTVLLPVVNNLFVTLGNLIGPIADFATNNQAVIMTIAGMAGGFILWKAAIAPIITLLGHVKTVWTALSLAMTANPVGLILMGVAVAAGAVWANWSTIGPWFADMWEGIKSAASSAGRWIVSVWNDAGNFFSATWQEIERGASSTWEGVTAVWNGAGSYFSGLWASITETFNSGIKNIGDAILSWSPVDFIQQTITGGLTSLTTSVPKQFTEFGSMIVTGLVDGITNMGSAVKDAIGNLASGTMNWFKEKLGIRSPSRVFTGLGQMVGEGAAIGIDNMSGAVGKAAAGLGVAATLAFQPTFAHTTPALMGLETRPAWEEAAGRQATAFSLESGTTTTSSQPMAAGQTVNHITNHFHITQQPGENAEALARRVAEMVQRADRSARRAGLGDWA